MHFHWIKWNLLYNDTTYDYGFVFSMKDALCATLHDIELLTHSFVD